MILAGSCLAACATGESLTQDPELGGGSGGGGNLAGSGGVAGSIEGKGGATTAGTGGSGGGYIPMMGGAGSGGVAGTAGSGGASGTAGTGGGGGSGGSGGSAGSGGKAGTGGTVAEGGAGGSPTVGCGTLPNKNTWTATASVSSPDAIEAIDADTGTRWTSTNTDQAPGMWLQIDFDETVSISEVTLTMGGYAGDYPRGYAITVSDTNNNTAGTPQVTGNGTQMPSLTIDFGEVLSGQYLLIELTMSAAVWWSVTDLNVDCQ